MPRRPITAPCLYAFLMLTALLPAAARAGEPEPAALPKVYVYKDWAFGMPRDEALARPGSEDCDKWLGQNAVCRQEAFLGEDWAMDMTFPDGGLARVSLRSLYDPGRYARAFAALARDFRLVALQSDEGELDLVALRRRGLPEAEMERRVTEFEARGLREHSLAYVFLDAVGTQAAWDTAASAQELLRRAALTVREAGLTLFADDRTREFLVLSFDMPHMEEARVKARLPKPEPF